MNLPFSFAYRYLFSKKSSNAINIISWVSVLGMFVGSLGLILVLSVFNGFEGLVISLYNSFNPDFTVTAKAGKSFTPDSMQMLELKKLGGIRAVAEVVEENALLTYADRQYIATIKGVDVDYGSLTGIDSAMYYGEFKLKNVGEDLAVVGLGIEQALGINYDNPFGFLTVYIPRKDKTTAINPEDAFNRGPIRPAGSFAIQSEFDSKYVFVPLSFARWLTGYEKQVSYLEIATESGVDEVKLQSAIQKLMGTSFEVRNRLQQNAVLYKVMRTEKWAVYAILTFILIVAAFNIVGSLSMLVIEKKKDIAILKAMGADESLIRKIFLFEGTLLSFIGCCSGFLLAAIIIIVQHKFEILKIGGGSFVIDAYPVQMKAGDFVLVFITVISIGLLASWFPSWRAAKNEYRLTEE
ncbi:MAG: FtsX-like permease family protein [Chitinophagaceae bacterium]|nr:FtsX-like permease family protein [Chitinophagaceae bacterium]